MDAHRKERGQVRRLARRCGRWLCAVGPAYRRRGRTEWWGTEGSWGSRGSRSAVVGVAAGAVERGRPSTRRRYEWVSLAWWGIRSGSRTRRRRSVRLLHELYTRPSMRGVVAGVAAVDAELAGLGVTKVVIPRKGRPGRARREIEHSRGFRRLIKWRTCSEGRITHLKHLFGWDRSLLDGLPARPPGAASGTRP